MEHNKELLIESVFKEAKELHILLQECQIKNEISSKSLFLKSIDSFTISKNIVPFLEIKDILSFRTTCKEINYSVSSVISLSTYLKAVNSNSSKLLNRTIEKLSKNMRRNYDDNEQDDIQMELESLKNVKQFLTKKLFQSEEVINVCRNDIDFLKSELRTQNEISDKLNETLSQTRNELEVSRLEKNSISVKLNEGNKMLEMHNQELKEKNKELNFTLEKMKQEKNNYMNAILKLKKSYDESKQKNNDKSEALKSLRNFFLTSTIFKIKNISDLEIEYKKDKKKDLNTTI